MSRSKVTIPARGTGDETPAIRTKGSRNPDADETHVQSVYIELGDPDSQSFPVTREMWPDGQKILKELRVINSNLERLIGLLSKEK